MIKVVHRPYREFKNSYNIFGDNVDELVTACVARIRENSKEFYRQELNNDLNIKGASIIDMHAGMGIAYSVILTGENGFNVRLKKMLSKRYSEADAIEKFVESNWESLVVLGNSQIEERFESWSKIVYPKNNPNWKTRNILLPEIIFTDPEKLQFCLPISDIGFWFCEFDRQQLRYIPNSTEHQWYNYYKGNPKKLVDDAKENSVLLMFIEANKLWIRAAIDVRDLKFDEIRSLFKEYDLKIDDYPIGRECNQMIAKMYYETHINEFRNNEED